MPVNNVGNHAAILHSPPQPSEREAGPGRPSHQESSLPLQSLRSKAGAVASGIVGVMRETSAFVGTTALLAMAGASGAEAARGGLGAPPSRGTTPARGAPPRKVMELPSAETSGLRAPAVAANVLPTDPMLIASAVVGTALGVTALAVTGIAAYNRWAADRKTTE